MPLFDPNSSVAVVVTAPSKVDQTSNELSKVGFVVERRTLDFDPDELEEDEHEEDESASETESEEGSRQ